MGFSHSFRYREWDSVFVCETADSVLENTNFQKLALDACMFYPSKTVIDFSFEKRLSWYIYNRISAALLGRMFISVEDLRKIGEIIYDFSDDLSRLDYSCKASDEGSIFSSEEREYLINEGYIKSNFNIRRFEGLIVNYVYNGSQREYAALESTLKQVPHFFKGSTNVLFLGNSVEITNNENRYMFVASIY